MADVDIFEVDTEAEASAMSVELCKEQARLMGLPYGTDGYTGIPGRNAATGELAPPGRGEQTHAVDWAETTGGKWAVMAEVVGPLNTRSKAGTRLGAVDVPALKTVDRDTYLKRPDRADDVARGPK